MARSNASRQRTGGRPSKGNTSNKMWLYIIGAVVIVLAAWFFLHPENDFELNGYEGQVATVKNGNTVVLTGGLSVELLGVQPTSTSQQFLSEHLCNKRIRLTLDNTNKQRTCKKMEGTTVRAYVEVLENVTYGKLNGYMLRTGHAKLNEQFCQDSLAAFRAYVSSKFSEKEDNTSADGEGKMLAKSELAKQITAATILILSGDTELYSDGEKVTAVNKTALGTGFFVSKSGMALTNLHVIQRAFGNNGWCWAVLADKDGKFSNQRMRKIKEESLIANGRKENVDNDVALIRLDLTEEDRPHLTYLTLAQQCPPVGETVATVGHAFGQTNTFKDGTVARINEDGTFDVNIDIWHGNSGGAVCDLYGRVVGMVVAINGETDAGGNHSKRNICVDVKRIREVLSGMSDVPEQLR